MSEIFCRLTVFFDNPFWIGVFEKKSKNRYKICKVNFGGSEPKDYDIYDFILKNYSKLKFTSSLEDFDIEKKRINPKRMQREINKELQSKGIGTKAQQALKSKQEEQKLKRKSQSKKRREEEKIRQFQLKQDKRKRKHRGH